MIPIAKPCLGEEEERAVLRVLRSGWLTQGTEVAAFEKGFADVVAAKHACAVSSATAALHVALIAIGVRAGDEVITVSHSFIAAPNVIRRMAATPVFVDVERATGNIDPDELEKALSAKTKVIVVVHQVGIPCDMAKVMAFARQRGIPVVEDAACALGSEILWQGQWQRIGKPIGDVVCFSFHPRKVLTCGEGGMLTTDCARLDAVFRTLRHHGMSIPDSERHRATRVLVEQYVTVGFNYRLTDLQAAVAAVQMSRLDDMVAGRRSIATRYIEAFRAEPLVKPLTVPEWARSNWQSFVLCLDPAVDQMQLMQALLDDGVASRPGIMCAHLEPVYRDPDSRRIVGELRNSEYLRRHGLIIPLFVGMTDGEVEKVIGTVVEHTRARKVLRAG